MLNESHEFSAQEVAEWIDANSFRKPINPKKPYDGRWLYIREEEWKEQLKEWGISVPYTITSTS